LWGRLIQKAPAPIAMLERFADRKGFEEIGGFLNSFFLKWCFYIFVFPYDIANGNRRIIESNQACPLEEVCSNQQTNPLTFPGIKPGVCSGLILSSAFHPV